MAEISNLPPFKCFPPEDTFTLEPFDNDAFNTKDIIIIFFDSTQKNGECIIRSDLYKLYTNSEVTLWQTHLPPEQRTKLVKIPNLGVWVKNPEIMFAGDRSTFYLIREEKEEPIGSSFGISQLHGEAEFLYTVEPADISKPDIKLLEDSLSNKEFVGEEYCCEIKENEASCVDCSVLPPLRNIKKLYCTRGTFTHIPMIPGLKTLKFDGCTSLTKIPVIPGLKKLYCIDCTSLTKIPMIPGLEELICYGYTTSLKEIPMIPGLKKLYCGGCTSLTEIPVIPGLKELDCGGCTSLTKIPAIRGLELLSCGGCTSLTRIPVIRGLELLSCYGCTSLTKIPVILKLESLSCYGCTSLTRIPVLPDLQTLNCDGCTSLTKIPVIRGLKTLNCRGCTSLTKIPVIRGLEELNCDGCTSLVSAPRPEMFSCIGCISLRN